MSNFQLLKKYTRLAQEKEAEFNWAEAEKNYQLAISVLLKKGEFLEAGETQERAAYCMYRAAYQSETREEFKVLLASASQGYGMAAEIYKKLEGQKREARILTNRTMEHFLRSWLIEDPLDRKTHVAYCVEEFKEALRTCEDSEESPRFGKACNEFLTILYALSELSFSHTEGLEIIETALDYGSKALEVLKKGDEGYEFARCYYLLSLFLPDRTMDVIESLEKQQELVKLGTDYIKTAVELAEKEGDPYLIGLAYGIYSYYQSDILDNSEAAISLAKRQLEIGREIKDRLIQARANDYLSYYLDTVATLEEDRDIISSAARKAILHTEESISHFKVVLNPVLISFISRAQSFHSLAIVETHLAQKRKYMMEGIEASRADLEYATETGSLLGKMYLIILLGSKTLALSKLERDEQEKRRLLDESMQHHKNYIDLAMQAQPFRYWNLAGAYLCIADLKAQFANREEDSEKQTKLLIEATADIENSLELFKTHFQIYSTTHDNENYATAQKRSGEILFQMFFTSDDEQYYERAIQSFQDAIETYKKLNMPSFVAEILWKIAWAHYRSHEYQKSATEFDGASRYYLLAGEKYPNHRSFYEEFGMYLEAWGNITRAMDYHSRDEYFLEKEFFEKAVNILTSSERWKYLGPNYLAWARLAEAENQSRNEKCENALKLFQESSDLFSNAKTSIEDMFSSIGVRDEVNMATELIAASDLRRDYCLGRVALEEAKMLDKRGEHAASSRRYGDAAQTFLKIVETMDSESDRQEIRPLHSLCLAWQRKTQAEAEASPDLYIEASDLFEEALEYSTSEKTRLLTRGHASFCKALSAGIQYEVNREEQFHQELVRHIGSATDFYVRAGYDSALDYSRATQRLFEAYQYMDRARRASDPSEKARYFVAAERLLGVSADAFKRAKHPEKRDEIIKLLQNLKQDRELAVSLSEILDTPGISSSTESFRAPTPSHEYPVGLESFEHADLQTKLFLSSNTFTTGEEFDLELELYNPGKTSASLVKVEALIPDDFEVSRVSGTYRYEDEGLDLRGKRIGPRSTIEISLKVMPLSKGEYMLEPRIVFIDDTGEHRVSEPEPAIVTVREMGILSWLRGNRPSF